MRLEAPLSSERTTVGGLAGDGAQPPGVGAGRLWSEAMTRPPASGTWRRTSVRRWSAAARTAGIHSPAGSSAVRQAWDSRSLVRGSPRRAATSSPALVRHRISPRVGHEHHRAHDSVAQRVGVAVGVVRLGALRPGGVLLVAHEGDRGGVGAEGRSGQGQSPPRRGEGLTDRVAPAQGVSPVVDLVEDDQGAGLVGAGAVQVGVGGHLGVGQGDAVEARAERPLGVGVGGVDMDADAGGGLGPLVLEVLSGADDRHLVDVAGAEQLGGHSQREGRLAGPGGGHREEVLGHRLQVLRQRSGLPGTQRTGGPPGGAARVGRGEVLGRRRRGSRRGGLGRLAAAGGVHRPPRPNGKRGKRGPLPSPEPSPLRISS